MDSYHGARARRAAGTRPGRTQLRRRGAQSLVGRRYNLHPDLGRVSLPRGGARHFQPQNRRLGDGNPSAHRTGAASAQPGPLAAPAKRGDSVSMFFQFILSLSAVWTWRPIAWRVNHPMSLAVYVTIPIMVTIALLLYFITARSSRVSSYGLINRIIC